MANLDALCAALKRRPEFSRVEPGDLEPLMVRGIAHDHVRIAGIRLGGAGALLRVPRFSQWDLSPEDALAYQSACFERAAPSGRVPRLFGVLDPAPGMPMGALVVEEISGRKARLPDDLPLIAECLASIHSLPLPPETERAPLRVHDDPVAGTLEVIEHQAGFLDGAGLDPEARSQIDEELVWARQLAAAGEAPPHAQTLVATDTHPGNFLIEEPPEGAPRAVFHDLEKALYGAPAIDLAHATLYTSTMWDADCAAALGRQEVMDFHRSYFALIDPALGEMIRPWIAPLRRLTWLRTLTWCARWRVESSAAGGEEGRGEGGGWSAGGMDPGYRDQVASVVADYFLPETIARVRAEWLAPGPGEPS